MFAANRFLKTANSNKLLEYVFWKQGFSPLLFGLDRYIRQKTIAALRDDSNIQNQLKDHL